MLAINSTKKPYIYLSPKEYGCILEHLEEGKENLCVFFENDRQTLDGEVFKEFVCLKAHKGKENIESFLKLNGFNANEYFTLENAHFGFLAYAKFSNTSSYKRAIVSVEVAN